MRAHMTLKNSWFGAALILVGAAILLDRTGVLTLGWRVVFWGIIAVAGGFKLYSGLTTNRRGAIFWGTGLLLLGSACVLDDLDVMYFDGTMMFSVLLLAIGIAFLLMLVKSPREWHLTVPALFFAGLGAVILLGELGYLNSWELREAIKHYWPVALILFGASLLLNRRVKSE